MTARDPETLPPNSFIGAKEPAPLKALGDTDGDVEVDELEPEPVVEPVVSVAEPEGVITVPNDVVAVKVDLC